MTETPNSAWSPYPIGRVPVGPWRAWWEAYKAHHYGRMHALRALTEARKT